MKLLIDMNLSSQWAPVPETSGWTIYLDEGALVTIDEKRSRARILPLFAARYRAFGNGWKAMELHHEHYDIQRP